MTTLFDLFYEPLKLEKSISYPKYDIYIDDKVEYEVDGKTEKGLTYLEFALAGFKKDEINISQNGDVLIVESDVSEKTDNRSPLFRNIAKRNFKLRFKMHRHAEVYSAKMEDGILSISLRLNIPDVEKPKTFKIE